MACSRLKGRAAGDHGWTLVELMAVVVIAGILGMVALSRLSGWTAAEDGRRFAREIANQVLAARRRAINTGQPCEVSLRQNAVQWRRRDGGGTVVELGPRVEASGRQANLVGAQPLRIAGVTASTLAAMGATSTFVNTVHSPVVTFNAATEWLVRVEPNGVVDGDVTNNATQPPPVDGLTVFVDGPRRMRVIIYPLAGRPQILDSW